MARNSFLKRMPLDKIAEMCIRDRHIGYENGVLGGVISVLNVLCSKGDKVLLHSPTYIGFTSSLAVSYTHLLMK